MFYEKCYKKAKLCCLKLIGYGSATSVYKLLNYLQELQTSGKAVLTGVQAISPALDAHVCIMLVV